MCTHMHLRENLNKESRLNKERSPMACLLIRTALLLSCRHV
uniref:Uncharacterized protein n=1 Tax=Anguilla anguilla TaxID=7936 RepID=A0A0E9PY29_ANGAN